MHKERILVLLFAALGLVSSCTAEPAACDVAVDRATDYYLYCVADLGLEVTEFKLTPQGEISVMFVEGTTDAQAERALNECEPAMYVFFEATAWACDNITEGEPASSDQLVALIDEAERSGFSGSASFVRNGELLLETARGLADRERNIPNQPNTAFDVGSIMKDLTAQVVLQTETDGLLSREDTLGQWLDAPADKSAIAIQQLLEHTAGFQPYHDDSGDFEPMDRQEALDRILSQTLLFSPGEGRAYSNSGYTLLAAIVEEATATPFLEYIRAYFDAEGFTQTGTYGDGIWDESNVAVGYGALQHGERNSPFDWGEPSWALIGNGGLVTTVRDLDKYLAALEIPSPPLQAGTHGAHIQLCVGSQRLYTMSGLSDFGFGAIHAAVPSLGIRMVVTSNDYEALSATLLGAKALMSIAGEYLNFGDACGTE